MGLPDNLSYQQNNLQLNDIDMSFMDNNFLYQQGYAQPGPSNMAFSQNNQFGGVPLADNMPANLGPTGTTTGPSGQLIGSPFDAGLFQSGLAQPDDLEQHTEASPSAGATAPFLPAHPASTGVGTNDGPAFSPAGGQRVFFFFLNPTDPRGR
ncbi:uncharacterized protein K452DRAFT_288428 [Aplosporella prunicola CBS 121167]|uniref:Uncharacterized protein n=1 Tax=Aplosporella prunicola CBS 121167 TaxID=1176127 RepID=A0A6A6B9V5_9PEZI|nr:uncharacterized protein K452DRAFT_288428 [Aplosporella prunicola CBS 121167]KAF2141052.1 hypothetical protein K452DRAFT_288428 [Aplosporella prunicola CBS 121167]